MNRGSGPLPSSGLSELERLRAIVASYFPVYETRIGPQSLLLAVRPDPATLEERFDRLRQELWRLGYIPRLRQEVGEEFLEVIRRPTLGEPRVWVNLALLGATIATTVFAGAMIWLTYTGRLTLALSDFGWGAVFFALPVLTILGLHELAHYAMARRRNLDATLPYFIPIPPPFLFGTFGAFVSIREPFPDRKALFDVGVAGPIMGFAAAIPIALGGLFLSVHTASVPATYCGPSILGQSYGNLLLGVSPFWAFLSLFVPSSFVNLHPLALAGWVGVLVTAINLLPAGSLDGGHVFCALFGDRARYVSYAAAGLLLLLGFFYYGWLIFAILVLFLGLRHPPPLNDVSRLDRKRLAVGAFAAGILVAGFVVVPIALPPGTVGFVGNPGETYPTPMAPAVIAADLFANLSNGDPIAHAYTLSASVVNVSVNSSGGPVFLTGASLSAWEANVSWTFVLPDGQTAGPFHGGTAGLPSNESFTVRAGGTAPVRVDFSSTETAREVEIDVAISQFCAPPSGGHAVVLFTTAY
jgi:membrane-associated protease RseP (regulator of RpoE activity)